MLLIEEFYLLGINYKTVGIEQREQLTADFNLNYLRELSSAESLVVINTCNRFEVVLTDSTAAKKIEDNLVIKLKSLSLKGNELYFYRGLAALKHLFRVVSSLDSMVIGETQIVNQVKEAYAEAKAASCLNKVLHRLFQFSFALAKQVRETGLGSQGLSISYVAVKLAEQIFANLANHSVLLIGSGVMSELALLNLQSRGCRNFIIANRTLKNAEELAKKFTAKATELSEVPRLLNEVDLVIGSASLSAPILDKKTLQMRRRNEPLFLIDLGVPRNFSPSIKDLTNIYLYDLDSLNSFIQKNLAARNEAALEAEVYIDYAVSKFESWIEKQHLITSELKIRDEVGAICSKYCNLLLRDSRLNISEELREELSYKLKSSLGQYVIDLLNETKEL